MKLSHVIDELIEERGLDRATLNTVMCEGMLAAYKKKYPDYNLDAVYSKKDDEISIIAKKTVVETVKNDVLEISLKKALALDSKTKVGDEIEMTFDLPIGRIEILKAKQIIAQKIKSIESAAIYKEFKSKEGAIVHGTIHKCERNGYLVKLQDAFAFLPRTAILPTDSCSVGFAIRALLREVLIEPRGDYQLFLERTSADFVRRLFELEIPEVFENIVEIKKIVRIPGYKTKVLVVSHDKNIDSVGTCIGVGGARIKPILKELGNEKVDVVGFADTIEELVAGALKPAVVEHVKIVAPDMVDVTVAPDQRSVAIGKGGNNISLASQLTGLKINIADKTNTESLELPTIDQESGEWQQSEPVKNEQSTSEENIDADGESDK
ncbi:MAG: Transcription termination factor NusA [candidate division TM6 bacterium GW2011_GWE2_41_16]|nr:MAG: Transcription termination factor NusA [candidate division TM6 bacterium GW2011_GWE2_41_16]